MQVLKEEQQWFKEIFIHAQTFLLWSHIRSRYPPKHMQPFITFNDVTDVSNLDCACKSKQFPKIAQTTICQPRMRLSLSYELIRMYANDRTGRLNAAVSTAGCACENLSVPTKTYVRKERVVATFCTWSMQIHVQLQDIKTNHISYQKRAWPRDIHPRSPAISPPFFRNINVKIRRCQEWCAY